MARRGASPSSSIPSSAIAWDASQISVGMVLRYRGDQVPFVTTFLHRKGVERSMWLLPSYKDLTETATGVTTRTWDDVPGSTSDTYFVLGIETGRFDKRSKKPKPLPDLVIIGSDGYSKDVKFGLNPRDVTAKFYPDPNAATVAGKLEEMIKGTASELEERLEWRKQAANDGW